MIHSTPMPATCAAAAPAPAAPAWASRRRPASRRRLRVAECLLLVVLLLAGAEAFAQSRPPDVSLEYAVKATYLYKLAPFVNWPPDTFASPDAPFGICLIGPDPFHDFLEKAVAGRTLGSHPFVVHELGAATPADGCQIVFIRDGRPAVVREALRRFEGAPVLTVTDSDAPDDAGSIVQFVMDNGRVRFDVDTKAAIRNHLTISSKLLTLALAVKGAG